jgi:hypothetical protein
MPSISTLFHSSIKACSTLEKKGQAALKIVIGYYLVEHSTLANEKVGK